MDSLNLEFGNENMASLYKSAHVLSHANAYNHTMHTHGIHILTSQNTNNQKQQLEM